MKFRPCTTGEALKWKVIVPPPTISLSAEVPLTVKSLGWTLLGSTGANTLTTKSVSCAETVLPQGGSLPITEQGASLGVGIGLEVAVAVAVGVTIGVAVAVAVPVAVGVTTGVAVAVAVAVAVGVTTGVAVAVAVAVGVEVAVGVGVGVPPPGTRNAYTLLSFAT